MFAVRDPRPAFEGRVEEVEVDLREVSLAWPYATPRPQNWVGQKGTNYKVFRHMIELEQAGFLPVGQYVA